MYNKILYLLSCAIFSIGATSFILSNTGTDPLDVFCLGIQHHTGLKIGTVQSLFAILCLTINSGIHKFKIFPISTFLTFFICGYLIDFFLYLCHACRSDNISYGLMMSGSLLCLVGSAGIITSGIGIRAMDLLALTLTDKTNKPFWVYKGIFELMLLVIGGYLGGPVGIGTVVFLLTVGWLIQPVISLLKKIIKI